MGSLIPHVALSTELLNEIECQHYLISTNGKIFHHPHVETLGRIIVHGGQHSQLCFNYKTDYNTVCDNEELRQQFGYTTIYPNDGVEGLLLPL